MMNAGRSVWCNTSFCYPLIAAHPRQIAGPDFDDDFEIYIIRQRWMDTLPIILIAVNFDKMLWHSMLCRKNRTIRFNIPHCHPCLYVFFWWKLWQKISTSKLAGFETLHSIKQLPWTWQSTGRSWFAYSYVCSGYTRPLLSHVNIHKRPSHCKKIFWYLALYWVLVFCLPIDVFKCVALFCSILHYIVIAGRRHSVTGSCLSQGHCAQQASALWMIIKRNTASKIVISSM